MDIAGKLIGQISVLSGASFEVTRQRAILVKLQVFTKNTYPLVISDGAEAFLTTDAPRYLSGLVAGLGVRGARFQIDC